MMSIRMLLIGGLALGGCVVDKQLGDTVGGDEPDGSPSSTSEGDPLGQSEGIGPRSDSDSASGDGTETMETDGGNGELCEDWTTNFVKCEGNGGAYVSVTGEFPRAYDHELCTLTGPIEVSPIDDSVQFSLACGDDIVSLDITSNALGYPLFLELELPVYLTTTQPDNPPLVGLPTFELRSDEGLMLAWINELDHEIDLPLEPLDLRFGNSGCPAEHVAASCTAGGSIRAQPVPVELGAGSPASVVFPGNSGSQWEDFLWVTVDHAQRIVCWDDDCASDDSGSFDSVALIVTPVNPE